MTVSEANSEPSPRTDGTQVSEVVYGSRAAERGVFDPARLGEDSGTSPPCNRDGSHVGFVAEPGTSERLADRLTRRRLPTLGRTRPRIDQQFFRIGMTAEIAGPPSSIFVDNAPCAVIAPLQ